MKTFSIVATLVSTSSAQLLAQKNLNTYLKSCNDGAFGSYSTCWNKERYFSQCCSFTSGMDTSKYCVSDQERNDMYSGAYVDHENREWNWLCRHPESGGPDPDSNTDGNTKDDSNPDSSMTEEKSTSLTSSGFTFSQKLPQMNIWFEWIYWSMAVWPVGSFFSLFVGGCVYGFLNFVMLYNLLEVFEDKATWDDWWAGPFRRAVVGDLIFSLGLAGGQIPLVGILTSWGTLVWA